MTQIERYWKIDTLDARGGLAFASCFEINNAANEVVECVFIGAPGFRPESVANGALGLSAGRGCFQIGLFIDDVEVTFPTADDVTEFVRRAYLKGGGGDGADGGGENPPPRPNNPPDLPESPNLPDENFEKSEQALANQLRSSLDDFHEITLKLQLGQVKPFDKWPNPANITASGNQHLLVSAAFRLMYEMLRRLPANTDTLGLVRWQRDARCLGTLIARLDLWPLLFSDPYLQLQKNLIRNLEYRLKDLPLIHPSDTWYIVQILFAPRSILNTVIQRDIVSYLSRMPLPRSLEEFIPSDQKNLASLYHLLVSFMGSPNLFGRRQEAIELVLFASACVVGPDRGVPIVIWDMEPSSHSIIEAVVQTNANNAWKWLREHLPGVAFPDQLEKIIASADHLRY